MRTEEVLGEEPPRADYVIIIEDEETEFDKEIFRIFRKHKIFRLIRLRYLFSVQ